MPDPLLTPGLNVSSTLELYLSYRPPYAWQPLRDFLRQRQIAELEWSGDDYYGRTFRYQQAVGAFTLYHQPQQYRFRLELQLDKLAMLQPVLQNIRRIFDLDVDITQVEQDLAPQLAQLSSTVTGLRLPGLWDPFEAGVRAILGQQVTVSAAHQLVQQLVQQLGDQVAGQRLFPTPQAIADSELTFLKMPQARRDTLRGFSRYMQNSEQADDIDAWQKLKGIGPWTCHYARMRGLSDPDIWLAGDAGVKNALKQGAISFSAEAGRPWRSYLTLQLWQLLAATAKPTTPKISAAQSNVLENH